MNAALMNLFVIVIVMGLVVGFINRILPMAAPFKMLLSFFATFICCIYILEFLGIINHLIPIPRIIG